MDAGLKIEYEAYDEFEKMISDYAEKATDQQVTEVLKIGAEEFRDDLLKLSSPRSGINKGSYTHLLDTFAIKQEGTGWLVGWGKYYGPIIENGWGGAGRGHKSSHSAIPHFRPTFRKNKEKYYKDMVSYMEK